MAANAYTITHVPTHQRGGPVTEAIAAMRVAERAPYEGRGCLIINGELVVFDTGRRPAIGEPALIIRRNGRLDVIPFPEQPSDRSPTVRGEAEIYAPAPDRVCGARYTQEPVVLVGAVRNSAA